MFADCRACGKCVCDLCSKRSWVFPDRPSGCKPQRVDDICFRSLVLAHPSVVPPPPAEPSTPKQKQDAWVRKLDGLAKLHPVLRQAGEKIGPALKEFCTCDDDPQPHMQNYFCCLTCGDAPEDGAQAGAASAAAAAGAAVSPEAASPVASVPSATASSSSSSSSLLSPLALPLPLLLLCRPVVGVCLNCARSCHGSHKLFPIQQHGIYRCQCSGTTAGEAVSRNCEIKNGMEQTTVSCNKTTEKTHTHTPRRWLLRFSSESHP